MKPTSPAPVASSVIAEQLLTLAGLADVDAKARVITKKLETLPASAKKADELGAALKKQLDEATARKEAAQAAKKALEHEVIEERNKIKKWEARAHEIRGEREHEALLSEIGQAKRSIRRAEDAQLEHMEVLEATGTAVASLNGKIESANADAKAEWAKVAGDLDVLRAEEQTLAGARKALLAKLPANVVKRYELVATKRQGVGVSIIRGSVCSSCKVTLPPHLCNQVRKGAVLAECPTCSRYLVHEASTQAPPTPAQEN